MDIYLVTGNKNKVEQVKHFLNLDFKHLDLDLDEIQSLDTDLVAEHKVKQAYLAVGEPVFVFDTSVEIACLNGFPGPLIKWFYQTLTLKKVCQIVHQFSDHSVIVKNTLTFYDGQKIKHFRSEVQGTIAKEPLGQNGFGWDSIFIPAGQIKTYAQFGPSSQTYHQNYHQVLVQFKEYLEDLKKS